MLALLPFAEDIFNFYPQVERTITLFVIVQCSPNETHRRQEKHLKNIYGKWKLLNFANITQKYNRQIVLILKHNFLFRKTNP